MGEQGMLRPWDFAREFLRPLLEPERLPEDPALHSKRVLHRVFEWLLQPEDLPSEPLSWRSRRGFLRWLLEPERLAQDPVTVAGKRGFFRILLGRESLPQDLEQG